MDAALTCTRQQTIARDQNRSIRCSRSATHKSMVYRHATGLEAPQSAPATITAS